MIKIISVLILAISVLAYSFYSLAKSCGIKTVTFDEESSRAPSMFGIVASFTVISGIEVFFAKTDFGETFSMIVRQFLWIAIIVASAFIKPKLFKHMYAVISYLHQKEEYQDIAEQRQDCYFKYDGGCPPRGSSPYWEALETFCYLSIPDADDFVKIQQQRARKLQFLKYLAISVFISFVTSAIVMAFVSMKNAMMA